MQVSRCILDVMVLISAGATLYGKHSATVDILKIAIRELITHMPVLDAEQRCPQSLLLGAGQLLYGIGRRGYESRLSVLTIQEYNDAFG